MRPSARAYFTIAASSVALGSESSPASRTAATSGPAIVIVGAGRRRSCSSDDTAEPKSRNATPTPSSSSATATRDAVSRSCATAASGTPSQHSDGVTSLRTSMSRTSSGSTGDSAPAAGQRDAQPGHDRGRGPAFPVGDLREHRAHERDVERTRHAGVVDRAGDRLGGLADARVFPVDGAVEADDAAIAEVHERGAQDRQARLVEQAPDAARDAPRLRELAAQLVVEHLDPAPTHALGAVRGDVGVREQLIDRHRVFAGRARDADARADEHLVAVHVVRFVQRLEQPLRESQRVRMRAALGRAGPVSGRPASISGQHTTNSSPPSRTHRSPPRNASRNRFATCTSNSSPAA